MKDGKSLFESKIKPILQYVGAIGASILMVAYIIIVIVMIQGFNPQEVESGTVEANITFAVVTAVLGFIIMQFLKVQGISFAKNIPDNIKVLEEYNASRVKKQKKIRSLKYYWIKSILSDLGIRCLSLAISTIGIVWIVIEGTKDWNMLLLAITNLLMFICFGLLQLVKAYDFYNEQHINYIKQQIQNNNDNKEQLNA